MRVLITGGCGFVGVNLIKYLSKHDCVLRILDDLSTGRQEYVENLSLDQAPEFILGDIRNTQTANSAVEGVDAVVHLAAQTSVVESVENPEEDWEINATGTFNLLEACRQQGAKRFVFASSNAVAGEQMPPIDETKIPEPLSPYGASKLVGEALCSAYCHSFGLETISLRFANLYGPYSEHKTSVIARFLQWAREGRPFVVYGDGNQTRDFVHVDDVCQAIYLALTASGSKSGSALWGEVFQIASGTETSVNELVEVIRDAIGKELRTAYEPERKGEIRRNYSAISKARRVLGFEPEIGLREGLKGLC